MLGSVRLAALALFAMAVSGLAANSPPTFAEPKQAPFNIGDHSRPQAPFHIAGNIYYVGTRGLGAYLIKTSAGAILIDGTLADNAPMIEANIRTLGLTPDDVKILLNTHAHYDHAGGLAQLKRDTNATLIASVGDRWALEHGANRGDNSNNLPTYPPVKVDRTIADRKAVALGGTVLTARLTPGHTPGCTTWVVPLHERGRQLTAVMPCSISVAGNVLVGNRAYPNIAADYRRSFALLESLHADIVLPAHTNLADVIGRHDREVAGNADAWLAPGLLTKMTREFEAEFDKELAQQQAAARN